ncbi:MAG TPA: NAD(P)H-dependent oxidoreductase subunit E [Bacteroidetes bacterium]|nr:NAD(P)H-dependent oxidoreductase subunit E [Bacteroidota bacterium]
MSENGSKHQEYKFSESELEEINKHLAKYPDPKSAVMPTLWIAQNKYNWLSKEAIQLVADTLKLPFAHVYGVATFYTQYYKKPVPKYVFDVCTCFACGELGGDEVLEHAKAYTKCDAKGHSEDGLFYFRHAECLGSCDTGPMCQVTNKHYVHNLNKEKIEGVINDLRNGKEPGFVSIPLIDQSKI